MMKRILILLILLAGLNGFSQMLYTSFDNTIKKYKKWGLSYHVKRDINNNPIKIYATRGTTVYVSIIKDSVIVYTKITMPDLLSYIKFRDATIKAAVSLTDSIYLFKLKDNRTVAIYIGYNSDTKLYYVVYEKSL